MNKRNKLFITFISLMVCVSMSAQTIIKPSTKTPTSFAIFIDRTSYEKAKDAVDAYRQSVETDGLGTYLAIDNFQSPEVIRELIVKFHTNKQQPLEGCVFIGDIPIPMIRDAQYLTSAFKMNQKADWKRSSVASDRFYDDLSLKFDFIKQDTDIPLYFYYSLRPDSKTYLFPDIYSGRIKPNEIEGKDKYQLLSDYLIKVVEEKRDTNNVLDHFSMARGHGYNSEDKLAWSGEQIVLREQMPQLFRPGNTVKFFDHSDMFPMKNIFLNEVQDPELDVMLFHHHGADDTQYINGFPESSFVTENIESIKRYLRSKLPARSKKVGKEQAIKEYMDYLEVPKTWCEEAFDPDKLMQDSLLNESLDIHTYDIRELHPGAKFILFDACYNGSFYEKDYLAGAYIFATGHTVATIGNTVNALQDKWPDEFIGLLAAGMRIGQFNRFTGYLESHLIGDPTFHFKNNVNSRFDINRALTMYGRDAAYWRKQLSNELPDVQAMALRQLLYAGEKNLPELYRNTYQHSDYFVVRMEAVKLLALNYPEQAVSTLKQSLNDSYELIRRLSGEYVERIGNPELIPALVKTYLNRGQEKRLTFRLNDATFSFDSTLLEEELNRQLQGRNLYSDTLVVKFRKLIDNDKKHIISDREELTKLGQKLSVYRNGIYSYRNHPTPLMIDDLLDIASDQNRPIEVRTYAVHTLGWYNISYRRKDIIQALSNIKTEDKDLRAELVRTICRLQGK
ncbi:HEAT repeat domain-containing protein [Phocaeicola oris]|uniref:HEAT repeat domain-containing protein n=1 Tax=Phocaeicola oris TaxID=2896850 RepID=UPI00234F637E|nr:HEAT repeat domain-containing protein [Phocaeicola oris]MCE2617400.1 HEAT repeat domain-containing protein [Phocaeicola oris]